MKKGFFVTGTDTDVGKTWVTLALMHFFKMRGDKVAGMKPIAAGCEWQDGQLKNEDALLIQKNASMVLGYELINPYAYEMPVSPHLAGIHHPVKLDVILNRFEQIKEQADVILVEGAGGWLAPINDQQNIADLSEAIDLPVIVVVAIRLGCINHAMLTIQAIQSANIECAGWIAVCIDPKMLMQLENINTLEKNISAPLLGVLPFMDQLDHKLLASNIYEKNLI